MAPVISSTDIFAVYWLQTVGKNQTSARGATIPCWDRRRSWTPWRSEWQTMLFWISLVLYLHSEIVDVVKQIKMIIEYFGAQLFIEERNLLSIAYKNITNSLRNSWRIVDTVHKLQSTRSSGGKTKHLLLIRRQRERIERELTNVCKDIVLLLDRELLPAAGKGEEVVFFSKMWLFRHSTFRTWNSPHTRKGDYCRYLAEFCQKRDRDRFAELSLNAYKLAYKHALATLHPLHPTRLGLALNFSVFYHGWCLCSFPVFRSAEI